MVFDYTYRKTSKIEQLITKINAYKEIFEKLPKLSHVQENILRRSTLKSSLYSARIEGNTLKLSEVEVSLGRNQEKKEVFQIFRALRFVRSYKGNATKEFIFKIHEYVMNGLTGELGRFRTEQSAIFNSEGVAIYIPPPPQKAPSLIDEFIAFINSPDDGLARVAILHFAFEKIHPFLDGNGRVGRILISWHLKKIGYDFAGLISFEEHLENNREVYYETLSIQKKDITEFVEFILEAIEASAQAVIVELQEKKEETVEDTLLPRRTEILAIIREHKMVSFDQIRRRFLIVNPRTLHYDLEYLLKKNLIRKLGSTRGVIYAPK